MKLKFYKTFEMVKEFYKLHIFFSLFNDIKTMGSRENIYIILGYIVSIQKIYY